MSARAASSRLTIASACRSSSSPASVIEIARGPPGRSTSFSPDDALEGGDLLADRRLGVAELEGGAAERARPGHRLERREVPHLDAEPVVGAAVGEPVGR